MQQRHGWHGTACSRGRATSTAAVRHFLGKGPVGRGIGRLGVKAPLKTLGHAPETPPLPCAGLHRRRWSF